MVVERTESGRVRVAAPWLDEPVVCPTWEEAYEEARRGIRRG